MSVLGWILAGALAAVFFAAGSAKLATPKQKLEANPNMAWTVNFSESQVKAIGAVEVLGALGVVLPWLLNIAPVLTPVAALGLAITMVAAAIVHGRRGEKQALPINAVLLVLALVVAVIRFSQL
ncbi:MAG: DoxX family protein [Actinomycetota bacterium]|nr:DoxX family protein [Actinomycetota bacterium]